MDLSKHAGNVGCYVFRCKVELGLVVFGEYYYLSFFHFNGKGPSH